MNHARSVFVVVTALCGACLVAQGLWIPAKAVLAQVLLQRAWTASSQTAVSLGTAQSEAVEVHRPWPWADTWPVARLTAPAHDVDLVVLHGASGEALAFGPGRMDGLVSLGSLQPIALAGHRDTHFAFLSDLEIGDELRLDLPAETTRVYRAEDAFRVDHRDTSALRGDEDDLFLVTCWPLDSKTPGPWRWVVRARRIG